MENNNSIVPLGGALDFSKSSQSETVEHIVAQVLNGKVDSVSIFIQIKAIAEVCDQILKDPRVVEKVKQQSKVLGKDATFFGGKVSLTNSTRYNYESSRDPQYIELVKQKEEINNKIKAREMYLKAIVDPQDILNQDTGELVRILPCLKDVSQSLRVTFDK